MLERSRQVSLIEKFSLVHRVENRDALLQQARRVPCAFDLTNRAMGQPRRLQKMPLQGPRRKRARMVIPHPIDDRISHDEAPSGQPRDERLGVREGGVIPGAASKPERMRRRARQRDIPAVAQISRQQMRHERTQREPDSDPLSVGRTLRDRRLRFGPAEGQEHLALTAGHNHLAVRRRDRQKRPRARAPGAPDPLDERGIRCSLFEYQQHRCEWYRKAANSTTSGVRDDLAKEPGAGIGLRAFALALEDAMIVGQRLAERTSPIEAVCADAESLLRRRAERLVKQAADNDTRQLKTLGAFEQWMRD